MSITILHLTKIGADSLFQKKRIPGDFGGGVATMIRDISIFMQKKYGCQSIITACYETDFIDWARSYQLKTVIIPSYFLSLLKRPILVLFSVKKIIDLIKRKQIDIIHAHHFNAALWGLIAAKLTGIPMVFTLHQNVADYRSHSRNPFIRILNLLRRQFLFYLWQFPYRYADCVMAVSGYVARSAEKSGFTGRNIRIVYNGINTEDFFPDSPFRSNLKELNLSKDHIVIGTTSRLDEAKGYYEIIRAAAEVRKTFPHVRFLIVGDGPEKNGYLKLAEGIGVDDIVFFPGFKSNIWEVLQNINIWLFPTYHVEGFSIALLEAQAAGLPSIVSNMGGTPECVINEKNGLVISPHSVKELSDAIVKLVENPDLAKSLGKEARKRVLKEFSIKKQTSELMNIYTKLIENRRPAVSKLKKTGI